MACLLAPATVAVITTSLRKKIPQKYHIEWLNTMLWGGVVMLAIEHIAHGEITLLPPFLTAMENSASAIIMLKELATVGSAMTVAIFTVWIIMVLATNRIAKIPKLKYRSGFLSLALWGAMIMLLVDNLMG